MAPERDPQGGAANRCLAPLEAGISPSAYQRLSHSRTAGLQGLSQCQAIAVEQERLERPRAC
jgi:hypothetical protein